MRNCQKEKKLKQEEIESYLKAFCSFFFNYYESAPYYQVGKEPVQVYGEFLLANMLPHSEIHSALSGNFLDFS